MLALIAVLFIKEKPLKNTSGMEQLSEEWSDAGRTAPGDGPLPRVGADA
ncbi:hypothetical protein SCNRRL3882_0561 [Streptomyces chartreusis NRRL 3882]|uniref:Uncharacterized protein n=1 Tax=Streptomyces chartreusis NRRL 3882 TaxID=1079985 RepID=A0A2N9B167_STRCX|nr:hypothetical protein SCNRRL3882_0561 [Streptomyces chartreusis NRRL 3882]